MIRHASVLAASVVCLSLTACQRECNLIAECEAECNRNQPAGAPRMCFTDSMCTDGPGRGYAACFCHVCDWERDMARIVDFAMPDLTRPVDLAAASDAGADAAP